MTMMLNKNETLRLAQCAHGMILYRSNDMYLGRCLDLYGEFSVGEVDFFRSVITSDMLVIDAGANIGIHTVEMSRLARVVISVEPERQLHQMLCANVALNDRRNVSTLQGAVGSYDGALILPSIDFDVDGNFGCMEIGSHRSGDTVKALRIDSLKLNNCGFIKIDVEGMESQVITGAMQTIRDFRPVLYVENDRKDKSEALIKQLIALDYRLYWHFPPLFSANNFAQNPENVFPGMTSLNMICMPDDREPSIESFKILRPDHWWERIVIRPDGGYFYAE